MPAAVAVNVHFWYRAFDRKQPDSTVKVAPQGSSQAGQCLSAARAPPLVAPGSSAGQRGFPKTEAGPLSAQLLPRVLKSS